MLPALMSEEAEHVEGIGMLRCGAEELPIEGLGLVETSGAVLREGGGEERVGGSHEVEELELRHQVCHMER